MNAVIRLFVLVLASVAAAGCVSRRSGGSACRVTGWREGVTVKRDVVAAWGNPDRIDGDTWIWRENRQLGGKVKASYYGVGLTVSRMNVATCEHRLEFDGKGMLVAFETVHSVPGGASWSLAPW